MERAAKWGPWPLSPHPGAPRGPSQGGGGGTGGHTSPGDHTTQNSSVGTGLFGVTIEKELVEHRSCSGAGAQPVSKMWFFGGLFPWHSSWQQGQCPPPRGPKHGRPLWFDFGTAPAQPGRGTSPTPDPSAEGHSGFRGTPFIPEGAPPSLPGCAAEKGPRGQCPPCQGAPGAGGG